ncbi:hypothetical protein H4W33_000547 [Kibdelosporangium phytohabitans]|nr:hypothetical protein [Kibdelosporangium phytohabitans]
MGFAMDRTSEGDFNALYEAYHAINDRNAFEQSSAADQPHRSCAT